MSLTVSPVQEILRISDLRVTFHTYAGEVKALDGVELTVRKGEILGLVGESGCGKSVTSLSVVGLLPPNARVVSGSVMLEGSDLLKASPEEMRRIRLTDIAMVFQDPMTYMNPVLTVGSQITEIVTREPKAFISDMVNARLSELGPSASGAEKERLLSIMSRGHVSKRELEKMAKSYVVYILKKVRLPEPEKIFKVYPYELSGGMRQRAMIAMAIIRRPKLILADEMTTALDVTVQAQILMLLKDLRKEIDTSVVLITHDLGVVAEVCDRVAVMYAGNIVEVADVWELYANPLHPYTQGLLASVPRVDSELGDRPTIKGSVPNLIFPPTGCRFHPRCPMAFEKCPAIKPRLVEVKPGHLVACLLYGE